MNRRRFALTLLAVSLLLGCSPRVQPGRSSAPAQEEMPAPPSLEKPSVEEEPAAEREPRFYISLYTVEALLAGRSEPERVCEAPVWPSGVAVRSDRSQALFYASDPLVYEQPPQLVDLATGQRTLLPVAEKDSWFAYAGWLPDGRLLLAGRSIWIGTPEQLDAVATCISAWTARLSPEGRHLALWGPNAEGRLDLVDLTTGEKASLIGPFRRGAQDGGVNIAWSPDGKELAGSDHDSDIDGRNPRIRVIDPATGATVRTYEGVVLVDWLPSGDLLAWRVPSPTGATDGASEESAELLVIAPDGRETRLLEGYAAASPDGRWLVQMRYDGQRAHYSLIEAATGKKTELSLVGYPRWTASGDLVVIYQD